MVTVEEAYENVIKDVSEMTKRLGIPVIISGPTSQYVIRFTMKRRWGGDKKYAYQSTLGNLVASVGQIEKTGGKIVGID